MDGTLITTVIYTDPLFLLNTESSYADSSTLSAERFGGQVIVPSYNYDSSEKGATPYFYKPIAFKNSLEIYAAMHGEDTTGASMQEVGTVNVTYTTSEVQNEFRTPRTRRWHSH